MRLNQNDEEAARAALNNVSHEATYCSVYYAIVSKCLANRDPNDSLAADFKNMSAQANKLAIETGMRARLSKDGYLARLQLASNEMKRSMSDTCTNIAVVNVKHGVSCKALMENPDSRFLHCLNEAMKLKQ